MSMFVQKIKEDVLQITHKFVNHMEVRKRNRVSGQEYNKLHHMECELASSRLILYASNWLNHLAVENITADKRSFYIDTESVNEWCRILEASPLYQKNQVFADIFGVIRRLQRVNSSPVQREPEKLGFSLS